MINNIQTSGAKAAPIRILCFVNIACGKISPNIRRKLTESIIDTYDGRILSRKMGKASIADVLQSSNVANRKWRCFINGSKIRARLFSVSFPEAESTFKFNVSKLIRAIVRPLITAEKITRPIEIVQTMT